MTDRRGNKESSIERLGMPASAATADICQIVRAQLERADATVRYIYVPGGRHNPSRYIDRAEYKALLDSPAKQSLRPSTPPPEYSEVDPAGSVCSRSTSTSTRYYPESTRDASQTRSQRHNIVHQPGYGAVQPWQPNLAPIDERYAAQRSSEPSPRRPMHEVLWQNPGPDVTNDRVYEWRSRETSEVVRRYRYRERHSHRRH